MVNREQKFELLIITSVNSRPNCITSFMIFKWSDIDRLRKLPI